MTAGATIIASACATGPYHWRPSQVDQARASVQRATDAKVKAAKALEAAKPTDDAELGRVTRKVREWEDSVKDVRARGDAANLVAVVVS